jgi:hypothetical protein
MNTRCFNLTLDCENNFQFYFQSLSSSQRETEMFLLETTKDFSQNNV